MLVVVAEAVVDDVEGLEEIAKTLRYNNRERLSILRRLLYP